jgi:hypothetical protein
MDADHAQDGRITSTTPKDTTPVSGGPLFATFSAPSSSGHRGLQKLAKLDPNFFINWRIPQGCRIVGTEGHRTLSGLWQRRRRGRAARVSAPPLTLLGPFHACDLAPPSSVMVALRSSKVIKHQLFGESQFVNLGTTSGAPTFNSVVITPRVGLTTLVVDSVRLPGCPGFNVDPECGNPYTTPTCVVTGGW